MQRPDGLEAKFKLLAMLPYDPRAKRKHCLVFGFVLDWYHSKYGNALASVRHIATNLKERDPADRGLFLGDVHSALSDLVEWGFLACEKGTGRRASRYVPVWGKLDSVRENTNTMASCASVRKTPNTNVRETPNATSDSVLDSPNEDPPTPTRSQDRGTVKEEVDFAPPVAGLAAAPVAKAGFEELFDVYGVRKDKADARRVYDKLSPDAELHERMVEAARTWRVAAGGIERMRLRRWIEEERFDEDPKGERPAKKTMRKAENNNAPSALTDSISPSTGSPASRTVTIDRALVTKPGGNTLLTLHFDTGTMHEIFVEHRDPKIQEAGQAELASLMRALDLSDLDDSSELDFRTITLICRGNAISFAPPTPEAA